MEKIKARVRKHLCEYFDELIKIDKTEGIDEVKGFFNICLPHPIENYPHMGAIALHKLPADVPESLGYFHEYIKLCVEDNSESPYPQVGEEILDQLVNAYRAYKLFKLLHVSVGYTKKARKKYLLSKILSDSLNEQIIIFSKTSK